MADLVTVSPRKDVEIPLRVPVPKKTDISLLRNDGYMVFTAKSIVTNVDIQFLGSQSLDTIAELIQRETMKVL